MLTSRVASSARARAAAVFVETLPRAAAAAFAVAAALLLFAEGARAQRAPVGGLGGEHEIYGEFKVDESKSKEKVPGSFILVLMNNAGKVIERQSAQVNSTFKFFGLRNGEYQIIVESVGMPIARIPVVPQ